MDKSVDEIISWLLSEKSCAEYHSEGLPADSFWKGYYQGKLDEIDFILRFIKDDWSKKYGGVSQE